MSESVRRGDIFLANLDPTVGVEIKKTRREHPAGKVRFVHIIVGITLPGRRRTTNQRTICPWSQRR